MFEQVAPGSAERILRQFEMEADHRRSQETRAMRSNIADGLIGQVSAIVFALVGLGVAGYAAHEHQPWIGGIVGGGVIVSGIYALRGTRQAEQAQPKGRPRS